MAQTIAKYLSFLTLIFLLSSCNLSAVYEGNVDVGAEGWAYDQAARFEVDINDSISNHSFFVNIRNDNTYRYSNLFVFLTTQFPNGNVTRDTIEFVLANDAGKWLGKGWGPVKENKVQLKDNLRFPITGTYVFLIQQAMRDDTLKGISDVGLIFEKNQ